MLAQYLVLLGATGLRKSKKKCQVCQFLVSQVNKEKTFHVHLLLENFYIISKNTFYNKASGSALFLIFKQIQSSCFYKIVLIKEKSVQATVHELPT